MWYNISRMKELVRCDCGYERLVRIRDGKPIHTMCIRCSNKTPPNNLGKRYNK